MATSNWNKDILSIKAIKSSQEKVDRVAFHPVQPYIAFGTRSSDIIVWNYDSNEIIYTNQLGGADDGALQEFNLKQRSEKNAAVIGGPTPPPLTAAQEASINAKTTASGALHDLQFYDLDTCFWQMATQHWLQHGSYDASSVPAMDTIRGVKGRRWLVAAFENKVTLHDLNSSESLDISRSAAFESKSPTRLAFLFLNAPSLTGNVTPATSRVRASQQVPPPLGQSNDGDAITPSIDQESLPSLSPTGTTTAMSIAMLSPVIAVGTSSGAIYLVSPNTGSVFAKLTGGHKSSITSLLTLGGDTPHSPDRLLSCSADGTVALWDPSRTPKKGADREISPIKTFKAHDAGVKDACVYVSMVSPVKQRQGATGLSAAFPIATTAASMLGLSAGADEKGKKEKKDVQGGGGGGTGATSAVSSPANPTQPQQQPSPSNQPSLPNSTATQQPPPQPQQQQQRQEKQKEDLPHLQLRLATVGDDKKLALWDISSPSPSSWRLVKNKIQPLPKASCHSVKFAPWGGAGLGVSPSLILASGESTSLLGVLPGSNDQVVPLITLQGMIDPGQKKAPKVYSMCVHPLRPHLMAAATNTGVVLLTADPSEKPSVVALPSQIITLEALMYNSQQQQQQQHDNKQAEDYKTVGKTSPAPASRGAPGFSYVVATGHTLWSTGYRLESRVKAGVSERTISLEASTREAIALMDHPGRPLLSCSTSGRSISAVWPETGAYCVYALAPTGTWEVIDKGTGQCVTWASTAPMYAVLSAPNILTPVAKSKKGFLGSIMSAAGRKEDKADEEDAAAAAAVSASQAATTVRVHVVDESTANQFVASHDVPLHGAQPMLLHGGALLGIVVIDPGTLQRSLRFFSWRDFTPVGPPLQEPCWVSWEPECTLCALAYEHTIEICRVYPTFQRFAVLSIPQAQAGIWQSRQIYVVTPSTIYAIFADPCEEFVQEIVLASFQGGVASKIAAQIDAAPLPPEQTRPAGPVSLVGVRHSYLWLSDAFGRPFLISLRHPGLRLRCLAARGELTTARTIAERGLSFSFHDDVARFFAAMSPGDGVKEALLLPGLSPQTEMALAVRNGEWDRAAKCFQAVVLDVSDKGILLLGGGGGRDDVNSSSPDGTDAIARGLFDGLQGVGKIDHTSTVEEILKQHHSQEQSNGRDSGHGDDSSSSSAAARKHDDATMPRNDDDGDSDEMNIEAAYVDPVDWDTFLSDKKKDSSMSLELSRHQESIESMPDNARALSNLSAEGYSQMILDPGELRRVSRAASIGLRFADAAVTAGHADAARAALGVLVRFVPGLPTTLLRELVARMGQCRMSESTRNIAAAAARARPGSPLLDPGVAALLASLCGGGHGDAVQSTLHAAGLAPLSAVYSSVWGQGSRDAAVAKWADLLGGNQGMDVRITAPLG